MLKHCHESQKDEGEISWQKLFLRAATSYARQPRVALPIAMSMSHAIKGCCLALETDMVIKTEHN